MNPTKLKRRMARPARDFLAGMMMFTAVAFSGGIDLPPAGTSWISSAAHARLVPAEVPDPALAQFLVPAPRVELIASRQQQLSALISLALAFSALFAANMWFARHLRHAHAAHRRRR